MFFFRYGALKPRFSNNENMPTIMTPQGDLIPDKEVPVYSLPFFIDEPVYVKVNNYFTEYSNGKLGIYQIDSAVHFSNNGGVYIASRNDEKYILKEGRKNVGISDRSCMDAFHRVKHEYQILRSLSSLSDVVNAVDCFDVWNHVFWLRSFLKVEIYSSTLQWIFLLMDVLLGQTALILIGEGAKILQLNWELQLRKFTKVDLRLEI